MTFRLKRDEHNVDLCRTTAIRLMEGKILCSNPTCEWGEDSCIHNHKQNGEIYIYTEDFVHSNWDPCCVLDHAKRVWERALSKGWEIEVFLSNKKAQCRVWAYEEEPPTYLEKSHTLEMAVTKALVKAIDEIFDNDPGLI